MIMSSIGLVRNVPCDTAFRRRQVVGRTFTHECKGAGPEGGIRDGKAGYLDTGRRKQASGVVLPAMQKVIPALSARRRCGPGAPESWEAVQPSERPRGA